MPNRVKEKKYVDAYANFLFKDLASKPEADILALLEQSKRISRISSKDKELVSVLSDKKVSRADREKLLTTAIPNILPRLSSTLLELCDRDQVSLLPQIFERLEDLVEDKLDTSFVEVITCVPLNDKLRKKLRSKCEKDLGNKIVLSEEINKDILGGLVLNYKFKRLDASLLTRMESLKSQLVKPVDGGAN